jgi:hypothetical protein
MTSEDVINRLAELFTIYGVPEHIRSDNGPEFIARAIQQWLASLSVKTLYVEPGSPWQNGYAESFHSRLRDELLNMEEFESVAHARAHANAYREDYNGYRPHSSLGGLPPNRYRFRCAIPLRSLRSSAPSAQRRQTFYRTRTLITAGSKVGAFQAVEACKNYREPCKHCKSPFVHTATLRCANPSPTIEAAPCACLTQPTTTREFTLWFQMRLP